MNSNDFKFEGVIVKFGAINDPTIVEPEITQHTISTILNKYFNYIKYTNYWSIHDSIRALACIETLERAIRIAYLDNNNNKNNAIYIYFETEDRYKHFIKISLKGEGNNFYHLFDLEKYRMKCDHAYEIPMESGEADAKISNNKAWFHHDYDFELNFNEVLIDSIMEINEAAFNSVQDAFNNINLKDEDKVSLNKLINDKTFLRKVITPNKTLRC
jgi:hypothetical protein